MTATTIALSSTPRAIVLGWYLLVGGWGVPNSPGAVPPPTSSRYGESITLEQVRVEVGPFASKELCEANKSRLSNIGMLGVGDCAFRGAGSASEKKGAK